MSLLSGFDGYVTALTSLNQPERTLLSPKQKGGRVRAIPFNYESAAANTDGQNIAAAIIPKGAKILLIELAWEQHAANADLDLGLFTLEGVEIDDDLFGTFNLDTASAGQLVYPFVATVGSDFYETTQECVLTLTVETANWSADKYIKGCVLIVENS